MRPKIDRDNPLPPQEQLKAQLRLLIDNGELGPGSSLPTIRSAAEELGLNPNTVAAAYRDLEREGYLRQRKRAGTTVAAGPPLRVERTAASRFAAEANRRARAAGVAPADLLRAVAAHGLLDTGSPQLSVAVLADTPSEAVALAERAASVLGESVRCVPLTPESYESVDYHLTVVAPRLSERLGTAPPPNMRPVTPSYLSYGPEFPAAAD